MRPGLWLRLYAKVVTLHSTRDQEVTYSIFPSFYLPLGYMRQLRIGDEEIETCNLLALGGVNGET